jgi:transcriptional regulator with XRE-family HTH domain
MAISRTSVARETDRRMRRLDIATGDHVRRMRLDAGVTLTQLAELVGVHRTWLARIEQGRARASLAVLTAIAVALGADLSLRYFPGSGPRLHDRFQAGMIETILRSLDPRWRAELEVPVSNPSRGVIDLVLTDRSSQVIVAAEVQSELRRLEEQIRRCAEKADGLGRRRADDHRSGRPIPVSKLLILRSTANTREIARRYEATLSAAYPARTRDVVAALTTATAPWPGSGIAWMHLRGATQTLMHVPPPLVSLGR